MNVLHITVIAVVGLALLALFVAAVVSILRSPALSDVAKVLWIVVVLVFPFVGPLVWLLFGRSLRAGA